MNYKDLNSKIEKAVDLREKGKLEKSRLLFEKIIKEIKLLLKTDSSKKLKILYTIAIAEHVVQLRLEAQNTYQQALNLSRKLLSYDKVNRIGNPLSIRSISNTLLNLGAFEMAEPYLRDLLKKYQGNSAQRGDTRSHLAYCLFRMGKIEKADRLVTRAIKEIQQNTLKIPDTISWYSHALMVKSLIFHAKNNNKQAIKCAQEALRVAKRGKKAFRIKQVRELLDFLKTKRLNP